MAWGSTICETCQTDSLSEKILVFFKETQVSSLSISFWKRIWQYLSERESVWRYLFRKRISLTYWSFLEKTQVFFDFVFLGFLLPLPLTRIAGGVTLCETFYILWTILRSVQKFTFCETFYIVWNIVHHVKHVQDILFQTSLFWFFFFLGISRFLFSGVSL